MRLTAYLRYVAAIAIALFTLSAFAGFYVSGTELREGNGSKFIMRGVNHPHAWYKDKTPQALKDISNLGANSVRVVLGNGVRWPATPKSEVRDVISKAKRAGLISVLEVHDTTGYGEQPGAANLASAANYWVGIKGALIGQEDYVILNVGNEPFGNYFSVNQWVDDHVSAIKKMRKAGLQHTIMVDAPNWGQDWTGTMRDNAARLLASDPARNVIFSVHMYEVYGSYSTIDNYLSAFQSRNLALVVGEFGHSHNGGGVDEGSIMSRTRHYGNGYLGWSWSGNSGDTAILDLVNNFNGASLTDWGWTLFYGNDGIAATSTPATIFPGGGNRCGFNSDYGYPICCHVSSDPDHDGWGWENNKSCTLCGKIAPNSYPYCCQGNATDSDGDGWGWENNRSCVVG